MGCDVRMPRDAGVPHCDVDTEGYHSLFFPIAKKAILGMKTSQSPSAPFPFFRSYKKPQSPAGLPYPLSYIGDGVIPLRNSSPI
jgi:hypothetical protein